MNWKQALALGLCSVSEFKEQEERLVLCRYPTAWDVEEYILPKLTNWDKVKYPYAHIQFVNANGLSAHLHLTSVPVVFDSRLKGETTPFDYTAYLCPVDRSTGLYTATGDWSVGFEQEDVSPSFGSYADSGYWTNHDIIKASDGSVLVAKSDDPVPVTA